MTGIPRLRATSHTAVVTPGRLWVCTTSAAGGDDRVEPPGRASGEIDDTIADPASERTEVARTERHELEYLWVGQRCGLQQRHVDAAFEQK